MSHRRVEPRNPQSVVDRDTDGKKTGIDPQRRPELQAGGTRCDPEEQLLKELEALESFEQLHLTEIP
jgi:hypothetical protein